MFDRNLLTQLHLKETSHFGGNYGYKLNVLGPAETHHFGLKLANFEKLKFSFG